MNHGLTISFVIGGMLLLMILMLNLRMGQHSVEVTYQGISQISKFEIAEMIEHDLSNIGYNISGAISSPISQATATEIEFESNIYNNKSGSTQIVAWKLGDTQPAGTSNPNHRLLYRIVDSDTTAYSLGVSKFELRYFKQGSEMEIANPNTPANRDAINRIEVTLEAQSNESMNHAGNDEYFTTTSWNKIITPPNLNLK